MSREPRCWRTSAWMAAGALVVPLLAGCVGVEETILPARIDYVCANKQVLQVARSADGRHAAIRVDGKDLVLQRAGSAVQEKYSNGRHSLYLDGERAMLEDGNRIVFGPCDSAVALPAAPRQRY